ncbi:MAG: NAD-dependent epimerase/dehydratase family protein [Hespellia sp.]|nr:NAD-dependent epimerase/dehydratase family protein [Hespellia sp.]
MDVLLIGGSGNLINAMIDKCKKSGHRVYLLTGGSKEHFSYKRVFEKYNFAYENEIIKDIFKSISPDITIFMGAYDANFDWSKAREEIVRYTTGLMNILSAYSLMKKGRFVYFSSQEVYGEPHNKAILETETLSPQGFKAMALAQGEEICSNYRKAQGLDIMVLRLDHVYGVPDRKWREDNLCFRMCVEAIRTGHISANGRHVFSMLYLNDAVELAYKAIVAERPKEWCYHISSMDETDELQLAQLIRRKIGKEVVIIDNSVGENYKIVLDGRRYQEEYGQKIFINYEMGVERLVKYLERHSSSLEMMEDSDEKGYKKFTYFIRGILRKMFPFAENVLGFIPFFMLNNKAVGSQYFDRLDFYLLYVLLFAIVHGQQQAIFSAMLAVAGYFFGQMYERTGFDILLDYNTYVWIAQLFIVGMVVGYMKDKLKDIQKEDEEEIRYLKRKMDDISDINDSNIQMKQNFEQQVVNQRDSLGKIYELTSGLEHYAPEEVLFYAAKILSQLMDSRSVAVYVVANEEYARLFSATSPEARELGYSIKYSEMEEMLCELKEHRVYVNRTMQEGLPLMASAVYEQEQMWFILMLWDIPWQRMTLAEANRFMIVCALIRDAALRAEQYLRAVRSQRYVEGTDILNEDSFETLVKAFLDAKAQGLTECELLTIPIREVSHRNMADQLKSILRQTDYLGIQGEKELQILLPNTNKEGAEIVRKRLQTIGISVMEEGGFDAS